MRRLGYIFMVFLAFSGCSSKNGQHELEYMDGQAKPPDDVYVHFLVGQIDRFPQKSENYIKLADIYIAQNNAVKAFGILEKGRNSIPNNIDILIGLSNIYLMQKNVDALTILLNRIKEIDSDNVGFLKLSSGYSLLRHDYANAMFFANRAILINPYDDENIYLRGRAQLLNRDSISALNSFEEAMGLNRIYRNFSIAFDVALTLKQPEKAKDYLNRFEAKYPTEELCYEWGTYYNEVGDIDTAKNILLKCIKKEGYDPRVNYELAKIYDHKSQDSDSAIYYVDQFIFGNYEPLSGYVLKAEILDRSKNYSESMNMYDAALEIDSTYVPAQNGLKRLEGKLAYLNRVKRTEIVRPKPEVIKPLDSQVVN